MGLGYAFLVLLFLFLCLLLGAAWLGSGVLWWKRRKRPGVVCILSAFAFVTFSGIIGLLIAAYVSNNSPESMYADVFHSAPPSGMVMLQGRASFVADSGGVDLAFLTDRATFDRIRPPSLQRVPARVAESELGSIHLDWWRPPTSSTEIWYFHPPEAPFDRRSPDQHFSHEWTIMTWEDNGYVQYHWSAFD